MPSAMADNFDGHPSFDQLGAPGVPKAVDAMLAGIAETTVHGRMDAEPPVVAR